MLPYLWSCQNEHTYIREILPFQQDTIDKVVSVEDQMHIACSERFLFVISSLSLLGRRCPGRYETEIGVILFKFQLSLSVMFLEFLYISLHFL